MRNPRLLSITQEDTTRENTYKQLNVYRIILFLSVAFPILLRPIFFRHVTSADPLVVKLGFAAVLSLLFIATYLKFFAHVISYLILFVLYAYTGYLIFLVKQNHFSVDYVLEFILFLVVASRSFNTRNWLFSYFIIIFICYSGSSIIFLNSPLEMVSNIGLLLVFIITISIFFELKLRLDDQEGFRSILLNTIFNESPDALFLIHRKDNKVEECNDNALSLFAIEERKEIIGKEINTLLNNTFFTGSFSKNASDKDQDLFLSEFVLKDKEGEFFYGNIAFKPIKVKGSEFVLLRISDVTDRVKYKETIEENRKMLRQVIDLVPHPIFLKDHEGRFLFVNKIFMQNNHLKEEQVLGKTDFEIFQSEQAKRHMSDDMEVIATRKEKFLESDIRIDENGVTHVFQTTKMPFYTEGGAQPCLLGISIDISERIHDKHMIEENRQMLMQILDLLPHHIYLKDSKGKFLLVNKKTADFYNTSQENMLGKTSLDFHTVQQATDLEKMEREVLLAGKPVFIPEEVTVNSNGNAKVENVNKIPFYLNTLNETGLLSINIDITEAKLSERALKESELKYKMLMDQASDGIYLSDQHGNIMEANPKACEMFGYSMEEFVRLNIKKLVDPKESKEAPLRILDMLDKQAIILERRFIKKDGTSFTVELSAKLLENGRHQAIIRDITERKKIERALKDNEKKFRSLIENSSDVIIIVNETFKVKFVSASVKRILGYNPDNVLGKSAFEFVHPDALDQISKIFSETLMYPGKNYASDELRIKNNKGEYLYFEIVAVNLFSDQNIKGIVINCHDITKRKITETELLNTNFELDSFVYKASHDLKAPLRSVMGLIKLAKLESKDEGLNVYLDMMNKSVISLDTFIKDLTLFSRNSRMDIEARIITFEDVISESLNNLMYMENANKIEIVKNFQFAGFFYSDMTRISTIINNLLSNAFKYHRFENNNPYINIQIDADQEKALILIEDNGMGIDPMHIDRIFEMFYRAAETSYGSGLGLYIVKNAVNKLNGSIQVESTLNLGTKFRILIPNLINKT